MCLWCLRACEKKRGEKSISQSELFLLFFVLFFGNGFVFLPFSPLFLAHPFLLFLFSLPFPLSSKFHPQPPHNTPHAGHEDVRKAVNDKHWHSCPFSPNHTTPSFHTLPSLPPHSPRHWPSMVFRTVQPLPMVSPTRTCNHLWFWNSHTSSFLTTHSLTSLNNYPCVVFYWLQHTLVAVADAPKCACGERMGAKRMTSF